MKSSRIFLVLFGFALTSVHAQSVQEGVSIQSGTLTVAFNSDPRHVDARTLPLISGKAISGNREPFGIYFGGVPGTSNVFELLDSDGRALKSVSISEFLAVKTGLFGRRAEKICSVPLSTGNARIIVKALATGDSGSAQKLILTFALKCDVAAPLKLRVSLPVFGSLEAAGKGFVFGTKSWSSAVAAAAYPSASGLTVTKNLVTITSGAVTLDGSSESAALWLVMDGLTGNSTADARTQGLAVLSQKRFGQHEPYLVIVSGTDKQHSRPGDTVSYNVVCQNIGTADAADVALSNPVPQGVQFLEGTATQDGTTASFERTGTGVTAAVQKITWKLARPLKPGEERKVAFKARVR